MDSDVAEAAETAIAANPMKRSPLKPINPTRRKANFARAYHSQAFVRWIHRLPCWACGYCGPSERQAAHTTNGGMGRKADAASIIALCNVCHTRQHQHGWLAIGMTKESAKDAAASTWARWEARRGTDED